MSHSHSHSHSHTHTHTHTHNGISIGQITLVDALCTLADVVGTGLATSSIYIYEMTGINIKSSMNS